MTKREQELLEIIKENPYISQNELADLLNIKRSSVAVHISNLIKKGYLVGRAYVINSNLSKEVCVIGGFYSKKFWKNKYERFKSGNFGIFFWWSW